MTAKKRVFESDCLTQVLLNCLSPLVRYALTSWLSAFCGLKGADLDEVAVCFEHRKMGVDDAKFITDKSALEDLGITKRKQLDGVFRGVTDARNEATHTTQKLRVHCKSTLSKKVIMSGPAIAWSRRHLADNFQFTREGDVISKYSQVEMTTLNIY